MKLFGEKVIIYIKTSKILNALNMLNGMRKHKRKEYDLTI